MATPSWESRAEKCRKTLQDSLNPEWLLPTNELPEAEQLDVTGFIESCGLLTPRELEITVLTATKLVARMAAGTLTAAETVTAFLKRAHVGHQLTNLATEFLIDDALSRAAELDEHFRTTGELVGPLHGIPISVKEHVGFKGRVCHGAYVAYTDNVPEEDALLLQCLRNAGAIFHVRTNEPQSLLAMECTNPIYGTTVNPFNRKLTPGGSSGGEGASIGLHCSAMGIGTDVGGSVRAPAAFCNSWGLRTTALRNPYNGVCLPGKGQESIRCVISPLAHCPEDIVLFEKAVLDQEPWDIETSLVPLPWKDVPPYKPEDITIGIMWNDGCVQPQPPMARGLKYAVEKLRAAGVKVIEFEPYKQAEIYKLCTTLFFTDGGNCVKELFELAGEPVNSMTKWSLTHAPAEPFTLVESWNLNAQREAYRAEYHKLMKDRGVDFILCPSYVGAAAEVGTTQYWAYTAMWNVLDQPSITFPTGLKADPALDVVKADFKPLSEEDQREYAKYVPSLFVGAPIGLQLVGKHFRDEETVAAADLVAKIVQG